MEKDMKDVCLIFQPIHDLSQEPTEIKCLCWERGLQKSEVDEWVTRRRKCSYVQQDLLLKSKGHTSWQKKTLHLKRKGEKSWQIWSHLKVTTTSCHLPLRYGSTLLLYVTLVWWVSLHLPYTKLGHLFPVLRSSVTERLARKINIIYICEESGDICCIDVNMYLRTRTFLKMWSTL